MSRESLDVVRRVVEVFNHGDIETILALTHPDFELEIPPGLSTEPDTYRGHDGMRRYWESFDDAMEEIQIHLERLDDAGASVVVAMELRARGRSTGIAVEQRLAGVWTIRDAKVMRIRAFASMREARDAVATAK